MLKNTRRASRILLVVLLGIAPLNHLTAQSDHPKNNPKLIVAIVVDQFRYDYLTRFRADYQGGLAQMLEHGAVFVDARYLQMPTVTAVGHSTFMSGAPPSVSGIVNNEWYERDNDQHQPGVVSSVSDPSTKLVGGVPGAQGSSPRRLLVSTLPDELKMARRAGRVISISMKDRSAILPAGHMADAAYWFDSDSNHFVTSTYYMPALPDWVKRLNDERPVWKYAGAVWSAVDAKAGDKPFCSMTAGTDAPYCDAIENTPFANELLEEMAEKAIENESLGARAVTDVLALSFSANDYAGHKFGPDAPEIRDISIRTDRLLKQLFDFIDSKVGAGNTLIVFTADHGVAPVPEVNTARKMPGGRLDSSAIGTKISQALSAKFGEGKWFLYNSYGFLYLNYETAAKNNADAAAVRSYAAEIARGAPHIARVFTRDELLHGNVAADPVGRAAALGFYGPRSADILLLPEPYYMFSTSGTTHELPYSYDNHVPVIFYGNGVQAGVYYDPVGVNDIAPTLAALLHVETPSGSSGRILKEVVDGAGKR